VAKLCGEDLTNPQVYGIIKETMMNLNFDIAAIIGLGSIAATLFWRMMTRIESKVDHVVENMTTRRECAAHRDSFRELFNGHDHTQEGDLVVIRRAHGQVQSGTEGLPERRSELLSEGTGKIVGKAL